MFHKIEEAINDLKQGKIIIVVDDENRENEGDFVAMADKVTPEMINFMITHGKGLVCTPISQELAEKLSLPVMERENTDPLGTAFTITVDHIDTTTGISAAERAYTVSKMIHSNVQPKEFRRPGHVFPIIARDGGVLTRQGHTEAAVDLAVLSGGSPASVICEIIKEDGTMARVKDLKQIADTWNLKIITIEDLIAFRKQHEQHIQRITETRLPTEYGEFKIIGYTNTIDDKEHIALVRGDISTGGAMLTRVHSECLTGDIFGSLRCDCGPQLHKALQEIDKAGKGVLIYMRQEGRGIGLINKLKAYHLQDNGLDTIEANENLGFLPDMRDYLIAAQILKDLNITQVKLMTNNPEKITALESYGIEVEKRVPLETALQEENERYMRTKYEKMGHFLHVNNERGAMYNAENG